MSHRAPKALCVSIRLGTRYLSSNANKSDTATIKNGDVALLFPGQGAQKVGMVSTLAADPKVRELYDTSKHILGYDLLDICIHGPAEKLNATAVCQPAMYMSSLAALQQAPADVLQRCSAVAGLSLGEYTALAFAGAMTWEAGLRLVKARAEAMQKASDMERTAMAAIAGLSDEKIQSLIKEVIANTGGKLQIANYLESGNRAIAGDEVSIQEAIKLASTPSFKARMAKKLSVSGAFHTEYMRPAAKPLEEALTRIDINIKQPRISIVSNFDSQLVTSTTSPNEIRSALLKQLVQPVLWEDSMIRLLKEGYREFYEVGTGSVLSGMLRRIATSNNFQNVDIKTISA